MAEIEIIGLPVPESRPRAAVFDFDGTISLIVDGWQEIFMDIFRRALSSFPGGNEIHDEKIAQIIDQNTGKRTISQAYSLVEEIRKLGGSPEDPLVYLNEFTRRLKAITAPRVQALKNGVKVENFVVPGIHSCLKMLREHAVKLCLVSGSPESVVLKSAELLGVREFFGDEIHGTRSDDGAFKKSEIFHQFLSKNGISPKELIGFGDGFTETRDVHEMGGLAIGIIFDKNTHSGVNEVRRNRLMEAGADWIISDYTCLSDLESRLFVPEAR
ncbi:MAG: HAD family hydrolase [Planctomycetia bacterium]|nr:HAD family hydrolase [Planctomycetia bacterium]